MSQIYFCTEAYIKTNTTLSINVDITDITPLVKNAADMWTRSTMGTYFYKDMLVKYNAQTLSADELNLLEEMQSAIAWRACADAVIELSYQLKNKGIQTQSGDFNTSPETKAIMFNHRHIEEKAEFYENRLYHYIKDNKDLFSALTNTLNKDSKVILDQRSGNDSNFNKTIFII